MDLPKMGDGNPSLPKPPHADPGSFALGYPRCAEALASSSWSDGTPKKPARASLTIFGGRWQGQLDLVGTALMLRFEVPEPGLFWDALEAILAAETVPWEKNPWVKTEPSKNGKK
jgi:hypothetical protein